MLHLPLVKLGNAGLSGKALLELRNKNFATDKDFLHRGEAYICFSACSLPSDYVLAKYLSVLNEMKQLSV